MVMAKGLEAKEADVEVLLGELQNEKVKEER